MEDPFPPAVQLRGRRCTLVPLSVEMAAEMTQALASPCVYEHIGGSPPSLSELTLRYERQAVGGSDSADQAWRNWIIRDDDRALGYVQATLRRTGSALTAEVAWVVRPEAQGHGVATDAAGAMLGHLRAHNVTRVAANIAAANVASTAVARRLGMTRADLEKDGEQVWLLALP